MEPAALPFRRSTGESEIMWELDFGVVELARAKEHGRSEVRREERVRSDSPVTVFSEGVEMANGWCLDRSTMGARVILPAADVDAIGTRVTMSVGGDVHAFRVVWAYVQENACVLGLERDIVESGEYPSVAGPIDPTLVSRAA
jgi:hypothetical protein